MAKKGNGIFLVYTDIDAVHDDEFNAWYNTEHLPDLLRLPGFLDAARYVAVKGGPKYLAVYELATSDTLKSPEFQAYRANPTPWSRRILPMMIEKKFTRTLGAQIFPPVPEATDRGFAPALQIGRMSVPEGIDREWNEWYSGDVRPRLSQGPGRDLRAALSASSRARRRYATVYEFEHEKVSETTEWNKQREGSSPRSGGCATR